MTYEELENLYLQMEDNSKDCQKQIRELKKRKVELNYVFDENQTVVWNREQVKIHNCRIETEINNLLEAKQKLEDKYREELVNFLIVDEEYGNRKLTEEKLKEIEAFMYEWREEEYKYEYGFTNTLVLYKDLIQLVVN